MTPTVTIESRDVVDGELVVVATYSDEAGTRTGPFRLGLPVDANDAELAAAVLALYPQPPAPPPPPDPEPVTKPTPKP